MSLGELKESERLQLFNWRVNYDNYSVRGNCTPPDTDQFLLTL